MKDFISKLFSDQGDVSEMRVMSMISLIMGSLLAIYGMTKTPVDYSGLTMITGLFVGAAFTGKVAQKRIEVNKQETVTTEEKND